MNGAVGVLVVNIAVASFFAAGYGVLALVSRSQRRALGFTVSYLIGMLSPAADFLVPLVGFPELLEWVSYSSFLLATLSISATFNIFHRRPAPLGLLLVIMTGGLQLRALIWALPRDTLLYGALYQLPFTLAALLAVRTVLAESARRPLHLLLAGIFGVIAVNFMTKPFLALQLGQGETIGDYTRTTYAVVSQASSGVLLLAAGIVLLLIVAHRAISESLLASEIDPLSGLNNRRGFDRLAQQALAASERAVLPSCAIIFDLDHFKRINDTHGHPTGDAVIVGFAALLRRAAPTGAIAGRMGGEEFVVLLEGATAQVGVLVAESVRTGLAAGLAPELPPVTVSAGVAQRRKGESLSDLLRRADQASYSAKQAGRDRVWLAADRDETWVALSA